MAKSNAEYFSHDTDASLDEKIIYLESLFGDSGYAWFFKMLETLGRANDFEIEWTELKCGVLARKFNTTQHEFNKFIVAATNPDVRAFVIENGKLYSPGLKNRLEKMLERRRKEADRIAEKRAKYNVGATNGTVDATSAQSKVKESKVKESKGERENAPAKIENPNPTTEPKKNSPPGSAASPQQSAWAPADPDTELNEMLHDDLCQERFFRQCQIPIDQFPRYIENFRLKANTEKKPYSNRSDFRGHFFSWARTEFEHQQKKQHNGNPKLVFDTPDTIREGIEFAERFAAERRARKG